MGENGRSRKRRDSCPACHRVIQGTVVPACFTTKSFWPFRAEMQFSTLFQALNQTTRATQNLGNPRRISRTCLPSIFLKAGRLSTASVYKSPEPHVIHQPQHQKY